MTSMRDMAGKAGKGAASTEQEYIDRLRNAIHDRRVELGLSQVELARMLDVSQQTINKWEHGSVPDPGKFPMIADALGIPDFGSPSMTVAPHYDRLPNKRLREELAALRRIVTGRNAPWELPADLHANPLQVGPEQDAPAALHKPVSDKAAQRELAREIDAYDAACRLAREQSAYETTRLLARELGIDARHESVLHQVLLALTHLPGGCLPDLPLLLRGESGRDVLAQAAMHHLPADEACAEMGIGPITHQIMLVCKPSRDFLTGDENRPLAHRAGRHANPERQATFRELAGKCSLDPLRTVMLMDDAYAAELLSLLHPVLGNPQVACRLSSVWHPEATQEALAREQGRRRRALATHDPSNIRDHAAEIREWDGRQAFPGICPDEGEQMGRELDEEDRERQCVIATIAERERVRQIRLRMWREQTGESVPFDEWQREQLAIWSGEYNERLSNRAWHKVGEVLRHLQQGEYLQGLTGYERGGCPTCVFGETEEDDWEQICDAKVIGLGRRQR